jgi:hypothetical protein
VDVEDVDTEGEDHIYDECRYVCMENPCAPPVPIADWERGEDPLELAADFVGGYAPYAGRMGR